MYQNFIGIDISKETFVAASHLNKFVKTFTNDKQGFMAFINEFESYVSDALIILETTGGYELELIDYLLEKEVAVHRANTRKVKHFIKSFGVLGKSDGIDALGLAQYGYERHAKLELFTPNPKKKLQKLGGKERRFKKTTCSRKKSSTSS